MAESVPLVKVKMLRDRYAPGRGLLKKDSIVEITPRLAERWVLRRIAVSADGEAPIKASPVKTFEEAKAEVKKKLEGMTKKELVQHAEDYGIEVPKKAKKDEVLELAIEAEAAVEIGE